MSKDIYLYVYTITGVDPLTGEIRNYHGITNDIWRRMGEHVRSGLITALCNDGEYKKREDRVLDNDVFLELKLLPKKDAVALEKELRARDLYEAYNFNKV